MNKDEANYINSLIKSETLSFDYSGGNACNTRISLKEIYDVIIPWEKLKHVSKGDVIFEDGFLMTANGISDEITKEEIIREMKIIKEHLKSLGIT